jgi:hypothetical protein
MLFKLIMPLGIMGSSQQARQLRKDFAAETGELARIQGFGGHSNVLRFFGSVANPPFECNILA